MFNAPVQQFVMGSMAFQITFAILPLVGERPSACELLSSWLFACPVAKWEGMCSLGVLMQASSHSSFIRGNTRTT